MLNKFLLSVATVLLATALVFSQGEAARASRTWEVSKYTIKAVLPDSDVIRQVSFTATLNLKNISPGTAQGLTLRISPSAEVTGVSVNGNRSEFSKGEEKTGTGNLQRVILRGLGAPSGTALEVTVSYNLKVDENSGLASISEAGSQFLPLGFWYPTPTSWFFARGADFAPTEIEVAGGLAKSVVAPGRELQGRVVSTLKVQPFFLAGDWEAVEHSGVSIRLGKGATPLEKERARAVADYAAEARRRFAGFFGSDFDGPLTLVAVRRGGGFSGGGVVLVDEGVFRREKLDSQTAVVVADAIAKTWLGNVAEVTGDGYGVIREGLSRYLATRFVESKFGAEVADVERLRQRSAYGAVSRRDGPATQISPIDDFYFSAMTNKGAAIWRRVERSVGEGKFSSAIKSALSGGRIDLAMLRAAFPEEKEFLDYAFDQVTDGNLMVGLPQRVDGKTWRVALRNTSPVAVNVSVAVVTVAGKTFNQTATVPARGFSEVAISSEADVASVEVDPDKMELQSDYSDDVSPRAFGESDLVLLVKTSFDRQDFKTAEKDARAVLSRFPRFDEVRILLARALLAQGDFTSAEREFRALLEEKLPSARALAWANVGIGEVRAREGALTEASRYFDAAVLADSELGATVAARRGRAKAGVPRGSADGVREFFAAFDKAAVSNRKAEVDALLLPGENVRFSRGIAGQAQEWQSAVTNVQRIDVQTVLVEVDVTLRMINKSAESGTAVFKLFRASGGWRISDVAAFEVR